jgi:hypothetical protein
MRAAGYNSRKSSLHRDVLVIVSRSLRHTCVLAAFAFAFAGVCAAANWSSPAQELARKIAAITGPGAAFVSIENQSSLSASDIADFRRELFEQLRTVGIRPTERPAAYFDVKVIASENMRNYVFVAQTTQGAAEPSFTIVTLPRPAADTGGHSPAVTLRKTLLIEQDAPILDVALLQVSGAQHLLVLEGEHVRLYGRDKDKNASAWRLEQALEVAHAHPFPRDLRGRLVLRQDHLFDLYLPGTVCASSAEFPLTLNCHDSDDPWPIGSPPDAQRAFFNSARDFFTVLAGAAADAPARFYSAVPLPRQGATDWLFSGVDGKIVATNGSAAQTISGVRWGSDIGTVRNSCGNWNLLATAAGDYTEPDPLRAYAWNGTSATSVADALEFNGPVTALWTAADPANAIAVDFNLRSGRYEAYSVSASCLQ